MSASHSNQVLHLYRQLLRYGNRLQYTDKDFFKNRIRAEFRRHQHLKSELQIEFELKRGQSLLDRASVL